MIDVGCDWGNSPLYWRMHGASKVVGFEADPKRIAWMKALRSEQWFDFRGPWKGETPPGDVFKIDCEGCETNLDAEALRKYPLWFVAIHPASVTTKLGLPETVRLAPRLEAIGGEKVYEIPGETMYRGGDLARSQLPHPSRSA
ncbi:MAG: hypothetical protein JRN16_07815 [Nitrososphaerota archaeon]|nr:hypothetical protein [Nitrososphaerota archaeon]MDG6973969.1 hypothetical protein [Nitrososphaerota archaeon]MDG6975155.1 hypothetical protein [Nitrososphaerota archaeon]MDG7019295.1 hypothetical protein [Nitrososphaerota archaeon]MDG7028299.1 hypothetical protein [Nitrososphaerota archaeon]